MVKRIVKEQFSEARIALQREVNKHPKLVADIINNNAYDWEQKLAEIGAYCLVVLDGMYMPSELEKLYELLFFKLQDKRSVIVMPISKGGE